MSRINISAPDTHGGVLLCAVETCRVQARDAVPHERVLPRVPPSHRALDRRHARFFQNLLALHLLLGELDQHLLVELLGLRVEVRAEPRLDHARVRVPVRTL